MADVAVEWAWRKHGPKVLDVLDVLAENCHVT
jgi:hypothetical protein